MKELNDFGASMYFMCAKMARLSAVLIGFSGFSYAAMASTMGREFAGLSSGQLFMVGLLGPVVMFALSVACSAAGNFLAEYSEREAS